MGLGHKYQIVRLQHWSARQLCEYMSIEDVCLILRQSHLYECRELEKHCLDFMKGNMTEVVKTQDFAKLSCEWPEIFLKVALHAASVHQNSVAVAIKNQQEGRKR